MPETKKHKLTDWVKEFTSDLFSWASHKVSNGELDYEFLGQIKKFIACFLSLHRTPETGRVLFTKMQNPHVQVI